MRTIEDEERKLREELSYLQREYQTRAKPIIDRLVYIESLKPPRPVFLDLETGKLLTELPPHNT